MRFRPIKFLNRLVYLFGAAVLLSWTVQSIDPGLIHLNAFTSRLTVMARATTQPEKWPSYLTTIKSSMSDSLDRFGDYLDKKRAEKTPTIIFEPEKGTN